MSRVRLLVASLLALVVGCQPSEVTPPERAADVYREHFAGGQNADLLRHTVSRRGPSFIVETYPAGCPSCEVADSAAVLTTVREDEQGRLVPFHPEGLPPFRVAAFAAAAGVPLEQAEGAMLEHATAVVQAMRSVGAVGLHSMPQTRHARVLLPDGVLVYAPAAETAAIDPRYKARMREVRSELWSPVAPDWYFEPMAER